MIVMLAVALATLVILAIGAFAALARTDDIDSYLFAYYGSRIVAGQLLYVDLWDNKPPGIFWVDAIGLFLAGGSYVGIVVMCSLATLGSNILFFLTARRIHGPAVAAIGVVMAAVYINLHDYHVGSNRPSTFYVFFELGVMYLYVRSFAHGVSRHRCLFAAGLCAVAAVTFRQTAFSAPATMFIHQILITLTRRQSWRDLAAFVIPFALGAFTATAAVIGALFATSDLAAAWHGIVTSNLGYFARPGKSELLPELFRWRDHLQVLGLLLILASATVVHAIATRFAAYGTRHTTTLSGRPPVAFALVLAWFLIALYLALIGPSKRMLYFGVVMAPLVMLATHGVSLLLKREPGESRRPRFAVIVGVLWFGYMMAPPLGLQVRSAQIAWFRRFDERSTPRRIRTMEAIRANTAPDDPLYIWGYQPRVYWHANRPLAQRYIVTTLIEQWLQGAQPYVDVVIEELRADPPKALVINDAELQVLETPPDGDSIHYGDFASWIRANYHQPDDFKPTDVWIRNY